MKNKWKIKEVGIGDITPTPVNANSMSKSMFNLLKNNIRKSGLSSTIGCVKRNDGSYEIFSGNHRFKAARELGYTKMNIIYVNEKDLTNDELIALQLSHNSVTGNDDKGILKRLLDEISSIEFKEFAGISVDDLPTEEMFTGTIVPVSEHYKVSFILYSKDIDALKELLDITTEEVAQNDLVIVADGKDESWFLEEMTNIKKQFKIKSGSIALSKLLELAVTNVTQNEQDEIE
jgi:hypothetical protein